VFCTYDNYWNNWTIRGLKSENNFFLKKENIYISNELMHIIALILILDVLSLTFNLLESFSKIFPNLFLIIFKIIPF
jgi:hypothetical protein